VTAKRNAAPGRGGHRRARPSSATSSPAKTRPTRPVRETAAASVGGLPKVTDLRPTAAKTLRAPFAGPPPPEPWQAEAPTSALPVPSALNVNRRRRNRGAANLRTATSRNPKVPPHPRRGLPRRRRARRPRRAACVRHRVHRSNRWTRAGRWWRHSAPRSPKFPGGPPNAASGAAKRHPAARKRRRPRTIRVGESTLLESAYETLVGELGARPQPEIPAKSPTTEKDQTHQRDGDGPAPTTSSRSELQESVMRTRHAAGGAPSSTRIPPHGPQARRIGVPARRSSVQNRGANATEASTRTFHRADCANPLMHIVPPKTTRIDHGVENPPDGVRRSQAARAPSVRSRRGAFPTKAGSVNIENPGRRRGHRSERPAGANKGPSTRASSLAHPSGRR